MAVYKEIGHLARKIKSGSEQIWPDAADHGYPISSFDDPILKQISGVMKLYGIQPDTSTYQGGATQTFKFSGGYPAVLEAGFEYCTIQYVAAHKSTAERTGIRGYVTVETRSTKSAVAKARSIDY